VPIQVTRGSRLNVMPAVSARRPPPCIPVSDRVVALRVAASSNQTDGTQVKATHTRNAKPPIAVGATAGWLRTGQRHRL
jgi:hypothetical protein